MSVAVLSPVRRTRFRLANIEARRADREQLLEKAALLGRLEATLVLAHLNSGLSITELAVLHGMTPQRMRRRLDRLRQTLSDPCFRLASQYGHKLPAELQPLARAYWLEGHSLRDLARLRAQTLHRIRQQVAMARSLLLLSLSADHALTKDQAQLALGPRR